MLTQLNIIQDQRGYTVSTTHQTHAGALAHFTELLAEFTRDHQKAAARRAAQPAAAAGDTVLTGAPNLPHRWEGPGHNGQSIEPYPAAPPPRGHHHRSRRACSTCARAVVQVRITRQPQSRRRGTAILIPPLFPALLLRNFPLPTRCQPAMSTAQQLHREIFRARDQQFYTRAELPEGGMTMAGPVPTPDAALDYLQ
ncbi:hypothetical protein QMK33_19430 [Hymenobacter sp. H14-R3]|uniref:hypothetical protein n=1 Tax=Hymenobacter sp. H14-R3 TaxID=3046308 RepID=UPI0024BB1678|nr:hypothetical protein [Hymenobacter sp. H14-R3]MDJ0367326.1 hypothetical protein [Hymenobacter sp. H14-R3]